MHDEQERVFAILAANCDPLLDTADGHELACANPLWGGHCQLLRVPPPQDGAECHGQKWVHRVTSLSLLLAPCCARRARWCRPCRPCCGEGLPSERARWSSPVALWTLGLCPYAPPDEPELASFKVRDPAAVSFCVWHTHHCV